MMINYTQSKTYPIENVSTLLFGHEYDITPYLKENVQWNKVMSVIVSFRENYNDFAGRFLKSTLIHNAIERYSNHKLHYIDDIGCDFYVPEKKVRLEFKGGIKLFQHRAKKTVEIRLKNFNGNVTELEKSFDYLVLCDGDTIGVVSYDNILQYYKKMENYHVNGANPNIHGFSGWLNIKKTGPLNEDLRGEMVEVLKNKFNASFYLKKQ